MFRLDAIRNHYSKWSIGGFPNLRRSRIISLTTHFSWIFIFNRCFLFEHQKSIHVLHFPLVFFIDAHTCGGFIDLFLEQQLKLFRILASPANCESLLVAFYAWDQVIFLLFLVLASFLVLIYFPIISCAERIISRKHLAKRVVTRRYLQPLTSQLKVMINGIYNG